MIPYGPPPVPLKFRFSGDGLPNDGDASTIGTEWARLKGNAANEALDFGWYKYGALCAFRSTRGSGSLNALEFHAYRPTGGGGGGGYSACATIMANDQTHNSIQVRDYSDTNGLVMGWEPDGYFLWTESAGAPGAFFDIGIGMARKMRVSATALQMASTVGLYWSSGAVGAADTFGLADAGGTLVLKYTGTNYFGWDNGNYYLFSNAAAILMGASSDTNLFRDGAGVLSQRAGTTAQEKRVYGTTTGPKYLSLSHNGTIAILDSSPNTDGVRLGSSGGKVGFYGTAPISKPTGVAVNAAGIHAALVNLGLIAA